MIPGEFEYQKDLQQPLASCPNLRVVVDTIAKDEIFVYDFLANDLLEFDCRRLSAKTRKSILKSALNGLAELHDRGIIHTGTHELQWRLMGPQIFDFDLCSYAEQISSPATSSSTTKSQHSQTQRKSQG